MTWHTPITWQVDQLVTHVDMNEQVRDNLEYLKDRADALANARYRLNEASDYSTSSASFVDVDATKLSFTLNISSGVVLVGFHGVASTTNTSDTIAHFDVIVDGTRQGQDDGLVCTGLKSGAGLALSVRAVSFVFPITGLSVGNHTFKLQWKSGGGAIQLRGGVAFAGQNAHGMFWVREL